MSLLSQALQASPGSLEDGSRTGTIIVTAGCYLLALAALGVAVAQARKGRYLGLGCLLGAFAVSWGEAIYDRLFHLAFYARDMTLWSPFGIDQPWWVNAVFIVVAGITIAAAQPLLTGAGPLIGLAVPAAVYLVGFTGITYGAGFLALAVHNSDAPALWVGLAAVAGNVIAVALLWLVADLYERSRGRNAHA